MVVEQIRMDPRIRDGEDLLEIHLEDLRTEILKRLKYRKEPVPSPGGSSPRPYLMYGQS
jgi:hypothetical protein